MRAAGRVTEGADPSTRAATPTNEAPGGCPAPQSSIRRCYRFCGNMNANPARAVNPE